MKTVMVRVAEVDGPALDWLVATARGLNLVLGVNKRVTVLATALGLQSGEWIWFRSSTDPAQAWPIIEQMQNVSIRLD